MADTQTTAEAPVTARPIPPQEDPVSLKAADADKEYVKPKVVRVRRVLAAGGHKL